MTRGSGLSDIELLCSFENDVPQCPDPLSKIRERKFRHGKI